MDHWRPMREDSRSKGGSFGVDFPLLTRKVQVVRLGYRLLEGSSSVVVLVIHVCGVRPGELECHSPVSADVDCPRALAVTLQRMEPETREPHVPRLLRHAEPPENQPQALRRERAS